MAGGGSPTARAGRRGGPGWAAVAEALPYRRAARRAEGRDRGWRGRSGCRRRRLRCHSSGAAASPSLSARPPRCRAKEARRGERQRRPSPAEAPAAGPPASPLRGTWRPRGPAPRRRQGPAPRRVPSRTGTASCEGPSEAQAAG